MRGQTRNFEKVLWCLVDKGKSRRIPEVLALTSVAMLTVASPAAATTQEELVRLLKAQAAELKALRGEVEALKRARSAPVQAPATAKGGRPAPAHANDKSLAERFVEKGRKPRTFRVPGTDIDARIYGFAKADFISRVNGQTSGAEDLFATNAIVVKGGALRGTDARNRVHARESRLGFEFGRPTNYGDFKAVIEADFFGVGGNQILSNSDTYRLRHAYGEIGPLLAGQFWSTVMDPNAIPNTLDFQGSAGYTFIRQAQFRYTHKFEGGHSLAFAVENPESRVLNIGATTAVSARDNNIPDFVLRGRTEQAWGTLQAALLVRNISGGTGRGFETAVGGSVHGRINVPFLGPKDNIVFQGIYGRGIGRYIQDVAGGSADAVINPATGRVELLTSYGGYIGFQHFWLDNLRSTILFSATNVETRAFQPNASYRGAYYSAANLIWSPVPEVDLGMEVQWGQRINRDGNRGEALRVQSSAKYSF